VRSRPERRSSLLYWSVVALIGASLGALFFINFINLFQFMLSLAGERRR